ncbi:hypothetical protein F7734_53195 [Scytonema sp. UIC 10036]|nr:hypothetical protein [Scytonema sp. UIC 10036]
MKTGTKNSIFATETTDRTRSFGGDLTGHIYSVTSLAFSPDSHTLVSGCGNKSVKIWRGA